MVQTVRNENISIVRICEQMLLISFTKRITRGGTTTNLVYEIIKTVKISGTHYENKGPGKSNTRRKY